MSPSWTCERCGVTTSFASKSDAPEQPEGWAKERGDWHCLSCRRELVKENATGETEAERKRDQRRALIEFELLRDPDADDRMIAKRARCPTAQVPAARKALRESGKLSAT